MLAIYCRISQEKEEGKDRSMKEQELSGIELADKLGLKPNLYKDEGVSGTWELDKRPAFFQLVQDILSNKTDIKAVFAVDPSRLYRNDEVRIQFLSIIRKNNIPLYFLDGQFDWNDPQSKFLDTILSAMNEFQVDITRKKVKAVLKRRADSGKVHGLMPYGYTRDENDMMVPHPEEKKVIELIFKWSFEGSGYTTIANRLNEMEVPTRYNKLGGSFKANKYYDKDISRAKDSAIWGNPTIGRILRNRVYIGERKYRDTILKIEPIIDIDTFEAVNQSIEKRSKKSGKKTFYKYLLNDMIYCLKCGKRYTGREVKDKFYYRCTSRIKKGQSCGNRGIKMTVLDEFIWIMLFVNEGLSDLVNARMKNNGTQERIDELEKLSRGFETELSNLSKERSKAVQLVIRGVLSEQDVTQELKRIDARKKEVEIQDKNNRENLRYLKSAANKKDEISKDLKDLYDNTPYDKKQRLFRKYIEKISILYIEEGRAFKIKVDYTIPIESTVHYLDNKYRIGVGRNLIWAKDMNYSDKLLRKLENLMMQDH